jgi:hypothetical protein
MIQFRDNLLINFMHLLLTKLFWIEIKHNRLGLKLLQYSFKNY